MNRKSVLSVGIDTSDGQHAVLVYKTIVVKDLHIADEAFIQRVGLFRAGGNIFKIILMLTLCTHHPDPPYSLSLL